MTIHDTVRQLRQEANARGGSTLLLWAADTLEDMAKKLSKAEYASCECESCKHRDTMDACPHFEDMLDGLHDCKRCETPCPCTVCRQGDKWEWRGEG